MFKIASDIFIHAFFVVFRSFSQHFPLGVPEGNGRQTSKVSELCYAFYRSFSLLGNKKINWKPSSERSQENELL